MASIAAPYSPRAAGPPPWGMLVSSAAQSRLEALTADLPSPNNNPACPLLAVSPMALTVLPPAGLNVTSWEFPLISTWPVALPHNRATSQLTHCCPQL